MVYALAYLELLDVRLELIVRLPPAALAARPLGGVKLHCRVGARCGVLKAVERVQRAEQLCEVVRWSPSLGRPLPRRRDRP